MHSALVSRDYFQNNMAGSEDRGPSDDNSEAEWSDFSSNSSTTNTLDSLPFSLRSLDPIFVLNTIISCFPRQSDSSAALSASDRAPNTSGTNDRFRKFSYYLSAQRHFLAKYCCSKLIELFFSCTSVSTES